jgi:photosystem II stability/assembly factor-like uncharacterized protein
MCFCLVTVLLISFLVQAQNTPAYDSAKGFFDYQRRMNAHYDQAGKDKAGYKQWKRLEWYFFTRLSNEGKMVEYQQLKQEALQKAATMKIAITNNPLGTESLSGAWTQVGPTSVNTTNKNIGRINRLAFLPSDANSIWAATAGGGLWKTTNGGTTWQPLTDGLPNSNLSGVAVQPDNPNIIYILTGDGDGGGSDGGGDGGCCSFGKYSTGVLKSTNGGITWTYTSLKWNETDNVNGFKIIMHPSSFNILYVASSNGIYKTTNGGVTWSLVYDQFCYDLEFKQGSPVGSIVYAGLSKGRVARSLDGGNTWEITLTDPDPKANRVSIAVTPANPLAVYALISSDDKDTVNGFTFAGLYYSTNAAEIFSWNLRASHLPNVFAGDGVAQIGRQQNFDHALAVNSFQTGKIVTGGISIFRSSNGGTTLSYIPNSSNYHVDIHELSYSPANNVLYAACDGGIYSSTDDGLTWTPRNGNLAITQYYRISTGTTLLSSINVLGGAQDNGSHLRTTNTSVFEQTGGKDGADNAISSTNSDIMFEGSTGGPFRYSDDHGQSFGNEFVTETILSTNYSIDANASWVTPIAVSPTNPNTIFLGYQPVIRGVLNSGNWQFINRGGNFGVSGHTFLKIAPNNAQVLFACDNNESVNDQRFSALYKSTDAGQTWKSISPSTAQNEYPILTDMAIKATDTSVLWVTAGGYMAGKKVFRSTDGGTTWQNVSYSLPNIPVNCIAYASNAASALNGVYIGTDIGVFYMDNTLGDWVPFSDGLPVIEITDLALNAPSGLLRAGTYGRGIWQTALYTSNCPVNENFTTNSHPPSEPAFVSVTNSITSTSIIIGAGANIQYKAGNGVTLNPGFRINGSTGAKFIAYIGPCPSGGIPPGYTAPTMNGLAGYLIENK